MKIEEVLQKLLSIPKDAEVWCETGDFGPCVSYDPAGYVGEDEDGWRSDGNIFILCDKNKHILKVSEVIDKLSSFDQRLEVMVSDGFKAQPYLINSYREFADREGKQAGYRFSDEEAKKYYGNLKYPLVVFDT